MRRGHARNIPGQRRRLRLTPRQGPTSERSGPRRPTLSIRQASTFSTMSVLALQSARMHRRRASCGCERTTPSSTSSFPATELRYRPRRRRLDGLLQDAAASAGVEVRDQTRVTALVREEDRVVGVRAARSAGQEQMIRASLVVGADGRHSTVARQVEAEEYLGYDAPRAMFWGYWNAPAFWRSDPAYPFGMYVANTDGHIRVIFQTDHDQLLIGSLPPVERAMAWRTDPGSALIADLASDSTTGPLIAGSAPQERVRGTLKERYFFRRAAGNGWALVGDAGHHKEFVIGDGITEALLQARSLASAIAKGTDRGAASMVAGSGRRRVAVFFPRAGRREAGSTSRASANRLFPCRDGPHASGTNVSDDGAPALAARNILCSTSALVGTRSRDSWIARRRSTVLRDGQTCGGDQSRAGSAAPAPR